MTADTWRDQIAGVLDRHGWTRDEEQCLCGGLGEDQSMDAHLAAAVLPILDAAVAEARAETARRAAAAGWDAAVAAMQYEDGQPVEIAHVTNPYRNVGSQP